MATAAQVLANRANARHSTGPKTEAGKAAVSSNATSHGLSAASFALLPHENADEFTALLRSMEEEHEPASAFERFLVMEMARAQWKLRRIDAIEAAILRGATASADDPWTAIASAFQSETGDALLKLDRYAASARRAWHKSLELLLRMRTASQLSDVRSSRSERIAAEAEVERIIGAALRLPTDCETKPMPSHLERELATHRRRNPLFDPQRDTSQMSKELRKWLSAA